LIKQFDAQVQSKGFSHNEGNYTYMINNQKYTNHFSYKNNDKLVEYYITIKHGLKRMGADLIANQGFFNEKTYGKMILNADKYLPLYAGLMKRGLCHPSNADESQIKSTLGKMQSLYHMDPLLYKKFAYVMMLVNRQTLVSLGNGFTKTQVAALGENFIETLQAKMYELTEIKAVRDLKFLEACIIVLMQQNKLELVLNKQYKPDNPVLVELVMNEYVKYEICDISKPPQNGELATDFKRMDKVDFPKDLCEGSKIIPIFL
jgi:hypothetical protein